MRRLIVVVELAVWGMAVGPPRLVGLVAAGAAYAPLIRGDAGDGRIRDVRWLRDRAAPDKPQATPPTFPSTTPSTTQKRPKVLVDQAASSAGPVQVPAETQASGGAAPVRFEVASVRPSGPLPPNSSPMAARFRIIGGPGTINPEQITYYRTPLRTLIRTAYGVAFDQISSPDWMGNDPYTIIAKVPPGATKEQVAVMLQNLLTERFRLVFHREKREFPVYALSIAKNGPKLKEAAEPDAPPYLFGSRPDLDRNGFPQLPAGGRGYVSVFPNGAVRMTARGLSIADLTTNLGTAFGSKTGFNTWAQGRIVDKTGLSGRYDFTLEYAGTGGIGDALAVPDLFAEQGVSAPSLDAALERQLGLKLEKSKAWLDVLVVDRAEKTPTEN